MSANVEQVKRTTNPIAGQVVEHAGWCAGRHGLAYMADERSVAWPSPLFVPLLEGLVGRLGEDGLSVERVYISHPGYGPEVYLRSCEVNLAGRLLSRVESGVEAMVAASKVRAS